MLITWKHPLSPQYGEKLPSLPRVATPPLYTELDQESLRRAKFFSQYSNAGALAAVMIVNG